MWVSFIWKTTFFQNTRTVSDQKPYIFFRSDQEGMSEEQIYFFSHQHSIVSEFFQSLWFALIANTDVICYLFIFLNIILSMSVLTLPMSLCVCLWATLSIPRPSKRFWLTVIAYTEVWTMFLFRIFPNQSKLITLLFTQFLVFLQYFMQIVSYFHMIEFVKANATLNLILLHLVLFHRYFREMNSWKIEIDLNLNIIFIDLYWSIWAFGR